MDPNNQQPQVPVQMPPIVQTPPPVQTTPPIQVPPPVIPPEVKKSSPLLIIAVVLVVVALISVAAYLIGTKFLSRKAVPTPTPVITLAPTATPDPTADWKIYKNSLENFSFKYPLTWTIDTKEEMGDERKENIKVLLTKDQAKIMIYANMVGIGGQGQNYEGKPFVLDGNNLFLFRKLNTYDSTQTVGITDSLTESLGVFRVGGKTYSITFSYPINYSQTEAGSIEKEFNQILSTFEFLEVSTTPSATPM